MRRPLISLLAAAVLLTGCTDDDEADGGVDGEIPAFADGAEGDDPVVGQGDVAERPNDAISASLTVDAESIDLAEGACVVSGVPGQGVFGFQAAFDDREGDVSVTIDRSSLEAQIELFVDGELVPVDAGTAAFRDEVGTWEVISEEEGSDGPRVQVVFGCPNEFEERFGDDAAGGGDVTPDPGQVD